MRTNLSNTTREQFEVHRASLLAAQKQGRIKNDANIARAKGPGDYLHDAILKWVGEGPTRKCGCEDRIRQMNAWGPACHDHIDEIVEWLMVEATNRGWWKLTTLIPCSRFAVKQLLILPAIRQAEAVNMEAKEN